MTIVETIELTAVFVPYFDDGLYSESELPVDSGIVETFEARPSDRSPSISSLFSLYSHVGVTPSLTDGPFASKSVSNVARDLRRTSCQRGG